MQRRNFLQNTGILIPAMIFASPSVFSSSGDKSNFRKVVFVSGKNHDRYDHVADVLQGYGEGYEQVNGQSILQIKYTSSGFEVKMLDGQIFTSPKMVFNSTYKIDTTSLSVDIETEESAIPVAYNSGKSKTKVRPELWAMRAEKFEEQDLAGFIKRKKHAFLCIS